MKNVIILKVGDPGSGSLPPPAEKEKIRAEVEKAFRDAGRDDIVVAVSYDVVVETHAAPPDWSNIIAQSARPAPATIMSPQFPATERLIYLSPQIVYKDTI